MSFIMELLTTIFVLVGVCVLLYVAGYFIELGRMAARKVLRVCDVCSKRMKKLIED